LLCKATTSKELKEWLQSAKAENTFIKSIPHSGLRGSQRCCFAFQSKLREFPTVASEVSLFATLFLSCSFAVECHNSHVSAYSSTPWCYALKIVRIQQQGHANGMPTSPENGTFSAEMFRERKCTIAFQALQQLENVQPLGQQVWQSLSAIPYLRDSSSLFKRGSSLFER
jgi:hypothetical protein